MNWFESLTLGVVQGLTEFLPISSDGHLILTAKLFERFTGVYHDPDQNVFFIVMLHLGTTAAILLHYRKEIRAGVNGLLGLPHVADAYRRPEVIRVGILVAVATAVLIPDKLFFYKWMKQAYDSPMAIGIGFWITAGVLMVTASKLSGGDKGPHETTILDALLIGLAQAVAPLPGVSRSGMTIAAALALGFRRTWAVQYSLMLAVPAILGAAVFEIKDVDRSTLTPDRITQTVAATIVAGLIGYTAILWLLRVVHAGRLWYFSVYLFVLGLAVIFGLSMKKGPRDGRDSSPPDRTSRAVPARSDDRRVPVLGEGVVDRPDRPRSRPDRT